MRCFIFFDNIMESLKLKLCLVFKLCLIEIFWTLPDLKFCICLSILNYEDIIL